MGNTDKYKVYQLYKSSDGINWSPRDEYKAVLLEEKSTDCGYSARTITTTDENCSGTVKVTTTTIINQESEDFGETWTTVSSSSNTSYEFDSEDCGYVPRDYSQDYLTLVARTNGTIVYGNEWPLTDIFYSRDSGATWIATSEKYHIISINVNIGDTVMWKGPVTKPYEKYTKGVGSFGGTASFDVRGNIMSLIYGDDFINKTSLGSDNNAYDFSFLFSQTKVVNAKNLILPATTLTKDCYEFMFNECSGLTTAPFVLPAKKLTEGCYLGMFANCINLTTAPIISATTMASGSCCTMFSNCRSLTTAPELPATTLAVECYYAMFSECTSLTTAPQLPATTLADWCYYEMFDKCTSLTTAPNLLAQRLVTGCYHSMFYGCSNLNYIKMLATSIADRSLSYWVDYVGNSGTFVKAASMTTLPRNGSGIPVGWTVENA